MTFRRWMCRQGLHRWRSLVDPVPVPTYDGGWYATEKCRDCGFYR